MINCNIKDVDDISNMKSIKKLDLSNNFIKDFTKLESKGIDLTAYNQKGEFSLNDLTNDLPIKYSDVDFVVSNLPDGVASNEVTIKDGKIVISKDGELFKKIESLSLDSAPLTAKLEWTSKDKKVSGTIKIVFDRAISINASSGEELGDFGDLSEFL